MPDNSAKSSLSEKARIDFPVFVFCKNQKVKVNSAIVIRIVIT